MDFFDLTAKIDLSPQTVFFFQKLSPKKSTAFSSLFLFSLSSSFLGGFSGSFCLRLLVFFSVKRLQFLFDTFSNIQQDNALAFTVTYTLIFVNVSTSTNIQVSLFLSFLFYIHTYIHTYFIGSSPRGFSESILHYKIINQVHDNKNITMIKEDKGQ